MNAVTKRFAVLCAVCAVLSCKSSSNGAPAEDVAAGKVIEVIGTVRVTSSENARELHVGDEVAGRDVIETGADSWVRVSLFHNNVTWGLGPEQRRKLSDSVAWRAPRGSSDPLLDDKAGPDRSVAAGRQAEREAADTRATVMDPGSDIDIGATGGELLEAEEVRPEEEVAETRDEKTKSTSTSASGRHLNADAKPDAEPVPEEPEPAAALAASGKVGGKADDKDQHQDGRGSGSGSGGSGGSGGTTNADTDVTAAFDQGVTKKSAQRAQTRGESSIMAPLPVVQLAVTSGQVDDAQSTAIRNTLIQRLRSLATCQLVGAHVTVRVELLANGSLRLASTTPPPPRDEKLAACLSAAFKSSLSTGIKREQPATLDATIRWPAKK